MTDVTMTGVRVAVVLTWAASNTGTPDTGAADDREANSDEADSGVERE